MVTRVKMDVMNVEGLQTQIISRNILPLDTFERIKSDRKMQRPNGEQRTGPSECATRV